MNALVLDALTSIAIFQDDTVLVNQNIDAGQGIKNGNFL